MTGGVIRYDNDCFYFNKSETDYPGDLPEYFFTSYNNVAGPIGAKFYSQGTMPFRLNNWQGVVSFHQNGSPPSYEASAGTLTDSGYLPPMTGAWLTKAARAASPVAERIQGIHSRFKQRRLD